MSGELKTNRTYDDPSLFDTVAARPLSELVDNVS
jgi:hypothetical protein